MGIYDHLSLSDFINEVLNFILINLCNIADSVDIAYQIIVCYSLREI